MIAITTLVITIAPVPAYAAGASDAASDASSNGESTASAEENVSVANAETSSPVATSTSAYVFSQNPQMGSDLTIIVHVATPDETAVTGRVNVYAGAVLLGEIELTAEGGSGEFDTSQLTAGKVQLRAEYPAQDGFAASEFMVDFTLAKATTTFGYHPIFVPDTFAMTWGDKHTVTVTVYSAVDEPRVLEAILDPLGQPSVLATFPFAIVDGQAEVVVDFTRLLPGGAQVPYSVRVRETTNALAVNYGDEFAKEIHATATTTEITVTDADGNPTQGAAGEPVTITARVSSPASSSTPSAGTMQFRSPDGVTPVPVDAQGVASITYTPGNRQAATFSAEYLPYNTDGAYLASSASVTVTPGGALTEAPVAEWSGELTLLDTRLSVVYPSTADLAPPTGTIAILDDAGEPVAISLLSQGVPETLFRLEAGEISLPVPVRVGSQQYSVVYSGDANYSPRTDVLPVVVVTPPVITLTAEAPSNYSRSTLLSIQVADVPPGLVQEITVYTTDTNEIRSAVGTITYDSATGSGYLYASLASVGSNVLTAEMTFTEVSGLASVSSPPQTVLVPQPFAPEVQLSIDSSKVWSATRRTVYVSVEALSAGRPVDVPSGTVAVIRDDLGAQIGSVTLTGLEPSGSVSVTLTRSDTTGLTASVPYGPFGAVATSAEVGLPAVVNETSTTFAALPDISDGVVSFELTATLWGTPLDATESVTVLADFDGVEKTVTLTRRNIVIDRGWLGTVVTFDGTVTFDRSVSGMRPFTVTSPGNGADVGEIDYSTAVFIDKSSTELTLSPISDAVGGEPLEVTVEVTAVASNGVVPTGVVTLRLEPSYATCETSVGGSCIFPGDAVRGGANTLRAAYGGDDSNAATVSATDFVAAERSTALDVAFSVPPEQWIVGETVTVTWTTTTSARPAAGLVTVVAGDATCADYARSDGCTFTVEPKTGTDSRGQAFSVRFASFDDAPDQLVSGFSRPRSCFIVSTLDASIDIDPTGAEACTSRGREGVIEDSRVTVTATLPTHYKILVWQQNGAGIPGLDFGTPDDMAISMPVTASGNVSYVSKYLPVCVTLVVNPNESFLNSFVTTDDTKGSLNVLTPPNCSNPDTPSEDETRWLDQGIGLYAVGTVVDILAQPSYDRATKQFYDVETFEGVARANNTNFGQVTMDTTHYVSATFAVPQCTPFLLHQGLGGSAAIVSATRPDSSGSLKPATGTCTSRDGSSGYVPGASVVIESVPSTGYSFTGILSDSQAPATEDLQAVVLNQQPVASGTTRRTVLVGDAVTHVYPQFSHQDCVTVTVHVIAVKPYASRGEVHLEDVTGADECAPPRATEPVEFGTYQQYVQWDTIYSVVSTARLHAETSDSWLPMQWGGDTASVTWSASYGGKTVSAKDRETSATDPVINPGWDGFSSGPWLELSNLPATERNVVINALYVSSSCATPTVLNPFNAPYQVRLSPGLTQVCQQTTEAERNQTVDLRAAISLIPTLRPVFSTVGGSGNDGRWYYGNPARVKSTDIIALEYCADLNLTVTMRDDDGTVRTLSTPEAAALIMDDGGCAPMSTRPSESVTTSLTAENAYRYSILDSPAVMPTFETDERGVSAPATLNLGINCVTVDVGDRTTRVTGPNCPNSADNRYLKGSVVQFSGDVHDDEGLDGWHGVDEQNGVTAWVIAETDRYVAVDIDYPSFWDKISNGLSGLAQRIVSAAVIVATGLVLAKMMVAKMVTVTLKGVGSVVALAGGGDDMLNAMTKADNAVTAVIKTVGLFSTCINTSAKGAGTLTALPSGATGAAGNLAITGASVGTTKYGQYLNAQGTTAGGSAALVIGSARSLVDLFGSNTSLYSRDAAQAWTSMGTGLGGCMLTGLEENAHLLLSHEQ